MHDGHLGKTCPFCQSSIGPQEQVVVCSECRMPHHRECWVENGGCTTYGCQGVELRRHLADFPQPETTPETIVITNEDLAGMPDPAPSPPRRDASMAWVYAALLTLFILLPLLGMVTSNRGPAIPPGRGYGGTSSGTPRYMTYDDHADAGIDLLYAKGDYAGAERELTLAVGAPLPDAAWYYHLGVACAGNGHPRMAIDSFTKYLDRSTVGDKYRDEARKRLALLGVKATLRNVRIAVDQQRQGEWGLLLTADVMTVGLAGEELELRLDIREDDAYSSIIRSTRPDYSRGGALQAFTHFTPSRSPATSRGVTTFLPYGILARTTLRAGAALKCRAVVSRPYQMGVEYALSSWERFSYLGP